MEPQNRKMMGWDVTMQRVRGGGRPVPKQVVGHAACRRYCLYFYPLGVQNLWLKRNRPRPSAFNVQEVQVC